MRTLSICSELAPPSRTSLTYAFLFFYMIIVQFALARMSKRSVQHEGLGKGQEDRFSHLSISLASRYADYK